ncbi:nucleotidyltransferase family protein [Haloarcula sp. CBA1130]|uniref:nucleotidyltransferase family protein n=1 Tax=unclassified Haloarcula TaxID=2624677 RepID=UPI00124600E4|nr:MULTISPECIES: nucleotidyltransferase family protein [unclassified Haloarcula]KAA9399721.1 nucleotidyltransferase family protein [Haloarcula sp. CBA1129]KAA9401416.1 nucleotidyltransferase family protein [Haloarcula sp. CBA1130]
MDGVVLAAGEGTRMRPLTADKPKAMVEVAGTPLLTHCFDTLLSVGVDRLVVVIGYRGDDIVAHYGERYRDTPIAYVRQNEQLGLAHALEQARSAVDGTFVVLNGDNVCRANLGDAVERHRETDASATLLVEDVSRAEAKTTGVVMTDETGRVTGLVEKPSDPPSTLVTRGFFVFEPAIGHACALTQPSERGEYELPDAIDLLLSAGHRVEAVELDGWCHNVNEPGDIDAVERRLD